MSAFYTFLSGLYNCLLKFISLKILLGEVQNFLREVLKISGEVRTSPHLSPKFGLGFFSGCSSRVWHRVYFIL